MAPALRSIIVVLLTFLPSSLAGISFPQVHSESSQLSPDFQINWSLISPSHSLNYHPCFNDTQSPFQCARLLVPLDWQAAASAITEPESPPFHDYDNITTIAIAILKVPAQVAVTDSRYAGPVLINPGGPGGSGVQFAQFAGEVLQAVVASDERQFDIVGFDPRGVGASGPTGRCWPLNSGLKSAVWQLTSLDVGNLASGEEGKRGRSVGWARAKVWGEMCAIHGGGQGDQEWAKERGVGRYMSTASVARDMLAIVEAEEDRMRRWNKLATVQEDGKAHAQQPLPPEESNANDEPNAMLQYIGFSYGTVIGTTFASMFPDRVQRMILDGVVDTPDYIAQGWLTNLQDTDKTMQAFYDYCFAAEPGECVLYDEAGPDAIEQSLTEFLDDLKQNPLAAVDPSGSLAPMIITYSDVKNLIFASLYTPVATYPWIARLLHRLRRGYYEEFLQVLNFLTSIHCPRNRDDNAEYYLSNDAASIIICTDGDDVSNQTQSEFEDHLKLLESQSSAVGGNWASIRLTCTGWKTRPKWRYTGPFGGNTSTPILWVGNTADPVTPVRNARSMAKLFPGSVVLQHDSTGHCSLFNAPSNCTIDAYRRYFASGELPKPGTLCPAAQHPFENLGGFNSDGLGTSNDGSATMLEVARILRQRRFPLGVY